MNRYGELFFCGVLALFLSGMGTAVVAAPKNKNLVVAGASNGVKNQRFYQQKRPPVEDSLIRPTVRRTQVPDKIYRQDRARAALKSGRIVSLSVIRKRVRQSFPGKIVDVRLLEPKNKKLPYIYMVKLLRKDGKLLILKINAATAKIVHVKGNG